MLTFRDLELLLHCLSLIKLFDPLLFPRVVEKSDTDYPFILFTFDPFLPLNKGTITKKMRKQAEDYYH